MTQKLKLNDIILLGTGIARREFMHVDDIAEAYIFIEQKNKADIINIGHGKDISIKELAVIISQNKL